MGLPGYHRHEQCVPSLLARGFSSKYALEMSGVQLKYHMSNSLILMMMGLSDLGNSILAKPGGLQEGAVMRGEAGTGQRLSGRLSGGRRRISPFCRGLNS